VEIKIGIQHISREVVIETSETSDEVQAAVSEALSGGGLLSLTDERGRKVLIPAASIGYVDIGGLLTAFKDEVPADEAKNLGALSALGFSVTGDGGSSDFSVRLTTK